eukprot:Skav213326  [mRNA]  locus=scaffold3340:115246:118777:+ [translate_table: standard]
MFRVLIAALLLCAVQSDSSQEFLSVPKVESDASQPEVISHEPAVAVQEVKEIEFDAASNPYIATSTTAECLALIFMIVACVICYLECCK